MPTNKLDISALTDALGTLAVRDETPKEMTARLEREKHEAEHRRWKDKCLFVVRLARCIAMASAIRSRTLAMFAPVATHPRGPSKRVRVAVQPRPEDVDGDAGHAPSEDRHKRSHLGHDLRVPVPSRLEGGRGDVEPGRRAADPVTGKEGIGHGKDRRRHGKRIPRPFSFAGGPWGFRFRSSEALSTSREALRRPGEEPPRAWNVGSETGELPRASSEVPSRLPDALLRSWKARTRISAERATSPEGLSDGQRRTAEVAGRSV